MTPPAICAPLSMTNAAIELSFSSLSSIFDKQYSSYSLEDVFLGVPEDMILGTGNCIVENNFERNFEKNSGTYPTDIAPKVSP